MIKTVCTCDMCGEEVGEKKQLFELHIRNKGDFKSKEIKHDKYEIDICEPCFDKIRDFIVNA